LTPPKRKPFFARVSDALRVLSNQTEVAGEESRAIISTTYPNFPAGQQQMALVRTANPGEYRYDGATIRNQGFSRHPVVHACIRAVADIVASVPLVVLQERGNYESRVPEDNPLQKLLDYPGPRFTARQFRSRFAVDYLGYGNSFFQMDRTAPNRPPIGLRPVNPESMQQVWIDPEGDPRRYDYANWAGIVVQVPVEDMLHFRDLDMPRPFQADVFGYPRGATAIGSMLADNEATQYVRQVVTNDGTPTFAVLMADEATSEDASAMQDRYRARVVDRGKRGTPAFFGAVKDIKPLGFTLSDLEFPDLRRVSREDICAAFGVDPRMVGIASASSDGGLSGVQYAEARARLVQHTIEPMFSALEDELNHWLAPEFGDVWIAYDHDRLRDLVENDTETSTRIRAEYDMGLRTWEESRTAIKLSPLPEPTDSILKTAGKDLIPAAVAVINPAEILDQPPATDGETPMVGGDTNAPKQIAAEATDTATGDGATPDVVEPPTRRIDRLRVRAYFEDALEGDQIEQLVELLEALVEKELPPATVKAALLAAFPNVDPKLIAEMVSALEGFEPPEEEPEAPEMPPVGEAGRNQPVTGGEMTPSLDPQMDPAMDRKRGIWARAMQELDRTEQTYKATAEALFRAERPKVTRTIASSGDFAIARRRVREAYQPGGELEENWRETYTPLVATTYAFGATEVAGVGSDLKADVQESGLTGRSVASVREAIRKRAARLAGLIGDTTAREVLAVIEASERAGLTVEETSRLVGRAVYGEERVDARSTMIARTESAGALSQGSWDQAQEMGDLYRTKEWLAFSDAETRETHTACMAQGAIPIDQPFTNGLMYPLDPSGAAAEVINCRCVLAYSDQPA
jgi:HK97 family phage portal protein